MLSLVNQKIFNTLGNNWNIGDLYENVSGTKEYISCLQKILKIKEEKKNDILMYLIQ